MKKIINIIVAVQLFLLLFGCGGNTKKQGNTITVDGQSFIDLNKDGSLQPYEDTRLTTQQRVEDLLSRLSLEDKAGLLIGTGMEGFGENNFEAINPVVGESNFGIPGAAGTTTPLSKFGLPAIVMTDGPAGVRISPTRENDSTTYYATGFPVGTALAGTWDVELVESIGKAIGNEALEYGADIQLAPALNIMRNPLCGRNFEYYSEDPLISGKIAAAMTKGVQSQNVGVSIKHFAANNNETNRMSIDVHVSQRALREIYLRGFEIAVKEANPRTVMSSYNKLNGTYTSATKDLLTTILRNEWGFKGLVMTDWFGGYPGFSGDIAKNKSYTLDQVRAGNDLLMPGLKPQKEDILNGLKNGDLKETDVDICVRRVLTMIFDSPKMKNYEYSNNPDLIAHADITRRAAADGMVLLKNNNETLPLSQSVKSIAAFGITSFNFIAGGTGSGDVHKAYTVSLKDGLTNAGYKLDKELEDLYVPYVQKELDRIKEEKKENPYMPISYNEMEMDNLVVNQKAQSADIAIITIGRSSGEFVDRKHVKGDFLLSDAEMNLVKNVSSAFHKANKKVVVVLNIGGVIETDSWINMADAVLLAWQPGQEGGNSVADILNGTVNPSGKLTMTFPRKYTDNPSSANFPGIPADDPKFVDYKEGIYVGYRYFTSFNVKPSFEFGYGLSYTTFKFDKVKISNPEFSENQMKISVDVKNTGKTDGKEVVQLYLSAPKIKLDKPLKELKAFAKTKLLKAGETQTVEFTLTTRDLASFNPESSSWIADKGIYTIEIGSSSTKIQSTIKFVLKTDIECEKVNNVLNNTANFTDLKR